MMAGEFFAGFLEGLASSGAASLRDSQAAGREATRLGVQQTEAEKERASRETIEGIRQTGQTARDKAAASERSKLQDTIGKQATDIAVLKGGQATRESKRRRDFTSDEAKKAADRAVNLSRIRNGLSLSTRMAELEKASELDEGRQKGAAGRKRDQFDADTARIVRREKALNEVRREHEAAQREDIEELTNEFMPAKLKRLKEEGRLQGDLAIRMELARSMIDRKPDALLDVLLTQRFGVRQQDGSFQVPREKFPEFVAVRDKLQGAGSARALKSILSKLEGDTQGTIGALNVIRDVILEGSVEDVEEEIRQIVGDAATSSSFPEERTQPIADKAARRRSEIDSGIKPGILTRGYAATPEWAQLQSVDLTQYGIDPQITTVVDTLAAKLLTSLNGQGRTGHHSVDLQQVKAIKLPFSNDVPTELLKDVVGVGFGTLGGGQSAIKGATRSRIDSYGDPENGPRKLFADFKDAQQNPESRIAPGDPLDQFTANALVMWGFQKEVSEARRDLPPAEIVKQSTVRKSESFVKWWARFSFVNQLNAHPDNPLHEFDYRGYFEASKRDPKRFAPIYDPADSSVHLSSQFKGDNHPNRVVGGVDTKTGKPVAEQK